nr:hypothetical protein [Tanacetum cinerariifolium]
LNHRIFHLLLDEVVSDVNMLGPRMLALLQHKAMALLLLQCRGSTTPLENFWDSKNDDNKSYQEKQLGIMILEEFVKYLEMVHLDQLKLRKVNRLNQQVLKQRLQELEKQHYVERKESRVKA